MQQSDQTSLLAKADREAPVIDIELLALDLTSCTRCVATLDNIESAIEVVRPVAEATGARVNVRKLVLKSEEQARQYRFIASPTIRVNGNDLVFETIESTCDSCTDHCGCDEGTSCRVWPYRGKEYTEAPVELVVEALLREMVGNHSAESGTVPFGEVPGNLRRFFANKSARQNGRSEPCCPPPTQETCCAPDDKSDCCDPSVESTCGCR
jgi:Domain of unknown function (DUF2703)